MTGTKAVVLLSGGIDSTVALSPEAKVAAIRTARRDALTGSERGDDSQLSLFDVEGEAAA